jgi:hypothetical protein
MIREIPHNNIPFIGNRECKLLGIVFYQSYRYLGYFVENMIVGVVGFKLNKHTAYLGGAFVESNHRHKGIYKALCKARNDFLSGKIVTANCTQNSLPLHLKNGAIVVRTYKNGITRIKYDKNL